VEREPLRKAKQPFLRWEAARGKMKAIRAQRRKSRRLPHGFRNK
jgi:hypothetical protein